MNDENILSHFQLALKNKEFLVYYQPKVSLRNYRLAGAEALVRWDGKPVMFPDNFIPVLEQSHDICELDFYMLEQVCADIHDWLDKGWRVPKISVNFSRRHLEEADRLLKKIIGTINQYNVPHELFEVELTETTTDVSFTKLRHVIEGLHEEHILTSVDDFGMGYSSMNLIRELPWDVLKIDKCFLPKNEDDHRQYVMLKHIISLAHDIGLDTIVEGVETIEQIKILKENNCFLAQGYFFDRPLPKKEFEKRLI